jgi:multidrug resistance efflux pump
MNNKPAQSEKSTAQAAVIDSQKRPSVLRAASLVAGALVLSVAATALVAGFSEEQFPGTLMTDSISVLSPATGRIEEISVASGEIILPDTELFLISDEELQGRIAAIQLRVRQLQSQLVAAQANAEIRSGQQVAVINTEIFETELQLADFLRRHFQHKFEVTAWTDYLDPADSLASNQAAPVDLKSAIIPRRPDAGEARIRAIISRATSANEVESLEAKIEMCERRLETLRGQSQLIAEATEASLGIAELREQLESSEADLAEIESESTEYSVEAPRYGMTGLIRHAVSGQVKKGEVLVDLFDRDEEFVVVEFPSRMAPQIRKGARVNLVFPGNEEREGQIKEAPSHVTSPANGQQVESSIAVRVAPAGRAWPTLPVGSTVYASFK